MKVENLNKAWNIAYMMIGEHELDEFSTKNAGYRIFRSTNDSREYICDLGDRLEVNTKDGKSTNLWIDEKYDLQQQVERQKLEIMKLKARLYDLLEKN